jgi:hypothetical protein
LHIVFLPVQDFLLGIPGLQGVCVVGPATDVRFRTLLELFRFTPARNKPFL